MPDLDISVVQQCSSLSRYQTWKVKDYEVSFDPNTWDQWACTCKGFRYNKKCKHIDEVRKQSNVCSWHGNYDIPQTRQQEEDMICPICGGKTEWVRVAV